MKQIVFSAIGSIGKRLPVKLLHVLVKGFLEDQRLIDRYGSLYLAALASKLKIVSVAADGEYGVMSSAPNDFTILRRYAQNREWAADVNARLISFFRGRSGTYLDIGANIGMTTVPLARYNKSVTCHAFEPEPINYSNLVRNIAVNCQSRNVTTHQLALNDREEVLPFELSPDNLGDHRLHFETGLPQYQGETERKIIMVPCKPLDEVGIVLSGPVFAKIDVQGAEPYVFAGGNKTLSQADAILVEWAPYHMARLKSEPGVVLDFLDRSFKFGSIQKTDGKSGTETPRSPIGEITNQLRETILAWRDDPFSYVDVIAEK